MIFHLLAAFSAEDQSLKLEIIIHHIRSIHFFGDVVKIPVHKRLVS